MVLCVCVGGGGGGGRVYLSQVKKSKYLDFSEDRMLANTYFQFVTNWNFAFYSC